MKLIRNTLLTSAALFGITAFADCGSGEQCFTKADQALLDGDYEQAFDYAYQGCDQGHADACAAVGTMYQLGRGTEQDLQQASDYLEKSCELGSGDGCAVLAGAYLSGKGAPQDVNKAHDMAVAGCNVDNSIACMLLGSMQLAGQGTEQDITTGQANLDKACALEAEVCAAVEQIRSAAEQAGVLE